ncbi:MAG TPA: vWA domain-containing protein, partial [Pyrinomonadaceae bacterium]|nr:vWA domain-containing protein [Pyrinomonadaceae bacterium]
MQRLTLRLLVALLTFLVSISVTAAVIINSPPATLPPVDAPPVAATAATSDNTLELVFVLDTTGSMGGLLEGAKQRVWGVVNEVMQSGAHPSVRVGLVAYRDVGDEYVTKVLPLTSDLDKVYTTLMDYRADGGGDGPENVRRALADGIQQAGWSQDTTRTAQIVFLVGDAPPHDDYEQEPATTATAAIAAKRGMIVNTIQCGQLDATRTVWQAIARAGHGQFFAIAQDGGVQAITTPYDDELSSLSQKLGRTSIAYGGGAGAAGDAYRAEITATSRASETKVATAAPKPAQAERALNKALNRDAYANDLLQSIENGSVKVDAVKTEDLPADLRKLSA